MKELEVEEKDKRWYVVTLFGKYETIITDRKAGEELGYTYHEEETEIILKNDESK